MMSKPVWVKAESCAASHKIKIQYYEYYDPQKPDHPARGGTLFVLRISAIFPINVRP